jgi:mannosyltransferase
VAAVQSRRRTVSLAPPPMPDYGTPRWFERLPRWAQATALLIALLALSGYIRARLLGGVLWYPEANAIGIASHPLGQILGVLRHGGGAPLYYVLLHLWIETFGVGESAVHGLSLLFGLLTVPAAMWIGWTLWGRRSGLMAATLFAFSSFLTVYAGEAQPYELLTLLGLLALGGLLHGFVYRRRAWLWLLGACLVLMLYTDDWAVFFWAGAAFATAAIWALSDDRRGFARDAALVFGVAALLYVPWLPTVAYQAFHATDPFHYAPQLGATVPRNLLGSDRTWVTLGLGSIAGLLALLLGPRVRSPEGRAVVALAVLILAALSIARLASFLAPAWASRYMGPVAAAFLLLAALGCARSGVLGLIALLLACAFAAHGDAALPAQKSDMSNIAAELSPYLRPGDEVLVLAPEQAPLALYYLPGGLRYATSLGPDPHPAWMNWDGAYARLRRAQPSAVARRLLAGLRPGQRLLVIRPLTEGEKAWSLPWARLVRRRAAQWGALLSSDPRLARLPGAWAPQTYQTLNPCCIDSSALVYVVR